MTQGSADAGLLVLPTRVGLAAGTVILGSVALIALVVISSNPLATLAGAVFFALFFGGFSWLLQRSRQRQQRENVPRADQPHHNGFRRALRLGLFMAAVMAATEVIVFAFFAWLWGLESVSSIAGGILLGVGLWQALDVRDLRRWQDRNGLVLCTRAGARRIAWTGRQARDQLVVVVRDGDVTR